MAFRGKTPETTVTITNHELTDLVRLLSTHLTLIAPDLDDPLRAAIGKVEHALPAMGPAEDEVNMVVTVAAPQELQVQSLFFPLFFFFCSCSFHVATGFNHWMLISFIYLFIFYLTLSCAYRDCPPRSACSS